MCSYVCISVLSKSIFLVSGSKLVALGLKVIRHPLDPDYFNYERQAYIIYITFFQAAKPIHYPLNQMKSYPVPASANGYAPVLPCL